MFLFHPVPPWLFEAQAELAETKQRLAAAMPAVLMLESMKSIRMRLGCVGILILRRYFLEFYASLMRYPLHPFTGM